MTNQQILVEQIITMSHLPNPIPFVKLDPEAIPPIRGTPNSAGLDLSALEDGVIPAHGKGLVKTGIAMAIPGGWYGRIAPRSSLAWKKHIDVGAGVIDADYRGDIGVVLFNHSDEDFTYQGGDRVAQLIIERCLMAEPLEVDKLDQTVRGDGGYGSTGV